MGVGGAVFDVIAVFLSNRLRRVVIDGIRSENARMVASCIISAVIFTRAVLFLIAILLVLETGESAGEWW